MHTYFNPQPLHHWFAQKKRALPWRDTPTPYAVWVSEVMLQQTQVAVVIPYFTRWMHTFPTIKVLANAPLDQVIKTWEGLGYYSRARNLHQGAKEVVARFDGILPNSEEALRSIKGIGPYTVGAILSFAFHKKIPAVDGNVLRVLSRYFFIEEDICKAKTQKEIRQKATDLLPEKESWVTNEALIELGAVVCKKKPKCIECPLRDGCESYARNAQDRIPHRGQAAKTIPLFRTVAVIQSEGQLLIQRGEKGKVMSDLHEFPYFTTEKKEHSPKWLQKQLFQQYHLKATYLKTLPEQIHTFTKYRVQLFPLLFETKKPLPIPSLKWVPTPKVQSLAFSSGHRKVLLTLFNVSVHGA